MRHDAVFEHCLRPPAPSTASCRGHGALVLAALRRAPAERQSTAAAARGPPVARDAQIDPGVSEIRAESLMAVANACSARAGWPAAIQA